MKSAFVCLVGVVVTLVGLSSADPPAQQQGWGQQQQQPQQSGWGQVQQQPQSSGGWGQQQQVPQQAAASGWGQMQQTGGWGQPMQQVQQGWGQQQQQSAGGGWGQQMEQPMTGWGQQSSNNNKGGKGGIDWGLNFALGYQGEKGGKGGHKGGHGGGGGGAGDGWSSEPETNIKKPSIGEIFRSIISLPREAFNLFKESGLWILFVPLIVIIPLLIVAFNAGKFFGGMGGWGWDKRSSTASAAEGILSLVQDDWNSLVGFLQDPKVQRAAKGFMDEFVAKRVLESIKEDSSSAKTVNKSKTTKEDKKKSS